MSNIKSYSCQVCNHTCFFDKDKWIWLGEDGAWCHGEKHEQSYFICGKHVTYRSEDSINDGNLPVSFCPDCK